MLVFDLDIWEIGLVLLIALIIIGSGELPKILSGTERPRDKTDTRSGVNQSQPKQLDYKNESTAGIAKATIWSAIIIGLCTIIAALIK
ncbi:MAG: hypothetical protein AAGA97_02470 [Pseudomonadota bacterium]